MPESSRTIAKASPPSPVDIGSETHSTAAAATAASTALPPLLMICKPASDADVWLVAIKAWAATEGPRPGEFRKYTVAPSRLSRVQNQYTATSLTLRDQPSRHEGPRRARPHRPPSSTA